MVDSGLLCAGLNKYDDAIAAYKDGLSRDFNNETLKSGLSDSQDAKARSNAPPGAGGCPFANLFEGPDVWAKIQTDPRTKTVLSQPNFVEKLQDVQRNPINLNRYMRDPRIYQVFGVLIGVDVQTPSREHMESGKFDNEDSSAADDFPGFTADRSPSPRPAETSSRQAEPAPVEPEPEPMDISSEENGKKERKALKH